MTCTITISDKGVVLQFDPPIPEGPHKISRAEVLGAGALPRNRQGVNWQGIGRDYQNDRHIQ